MKIQEVQINVTGQEGQKDTLVIGGANVTETKIAQVPFTKREALHKVVDLVKAGNKVTKAKLIKQTQVLVEGKVKITEKVELEDLMKHPMIVRVITNQRAKAKSVKAKA